MKKSNDLVSPDELKSATAPGDNNGPPVAAGDLPRQPDSTITMPDGRIPPRQQANVGDFARDLNPPPPGSVSISQPVVPGNLMGPQHPSFGGITSGGQTNPNDDFRSGFGMRPRFDPFGPPGGPQQVYPPRNPEGVGRRPPPPTVGGEPNPDHLRPPNSLGDDSMFS